VLGPSQAALPSTSAPAAAHPPGYLRAEEPADTIMRTRTYDLYITYDQVGKSGRVKRCAV